jgi:hypothetical protein
MLPLHASLLAVSLAHAKGTVPGVRCDSAIRDTPHQCDISVQVAVNPQPLPPRDPQPLRPTPKVHV